MKICSVVYFGDEQKIPFLTDNIQVFCFDASIPPEERPAYIKSCFSEFDAPYFTVVNEDDTFPNDFWAALYNVILSASMPALITLPRRLKAGTMNQQSPFTASSKKIDSSVVERNIFHSPDILPTRLCGTFVRTSEDILAHFEDVGLYTEENFILQILLEHPDFHFYNQHKMVTAIPEEEAYAYYQPVYTKSWYLEDLSSWFIPFLKKVQEQKGRIPAFIQYFVLRKLNNRFEANINNSNKHILETEDEFNEFLSICREIFLLLDEHYMVDTSSYPPYYTCGVERMRMFLRIRKDNPEFDFDHTCFRGSASLHYKHYNLITTDKFKCNISFMEYRNSRLYIDMDVPDFFQSEYTTYCVKFKGKTYYPVLNQEYSHTKYFGHSAYKRKRFFVSLPLKKTASKPHSVTFIARIENHDYPLKVQYNSHFSRLSNAFTNCYWAFSYFVATPEACGFTITLREDFDVDAREAALQAEMALQVKNEAVQEQLRLRKLYFKSRDDWSKKKIWLFWDKIYKGGDSAEYLFRYAREQKDNISCYYLIDEEVPDYQRLVNDGITPVVRGSDEHRLLFLCADMIIISNSTAFAFNDYTLKTSSYIRDLINSHIVCVQHGMSVQKIAVAQRRLRDNIRCYFCASKYELENLSKPIYGYTDELKLTGVPRYDGLKRGQETNTIMISPTWRMQAAMPVRKNEGVQRDYNPNFKESSYYKVFNSLINDPRLIEAVKKYNYRIAYVLHPIVSSQVDDFDGNAYVDIIPATGDMSYEKLFCTSKLMVTDFSGIQFDFAYMRKPLVYLHHKDIPQHYEEGTFHYDTMAFGEIVHDNDELIDMLISYMENDCQMKPEYIERADDFFHFSDHNNCKRIYDVMLNYQNTVIDPMKAELYAEENEITIPLFQRMFKWNH